MKRKADNEKAGIFKGVFVAYAILLLHVVLVCGLGLLVFFFSGMVNYMGWILLGGIGLLSASAYFFYRRMKEEGKNLREMIRTPLLTGRSVEISVMGGLASLKIGKAGGESLPAIEASPNLFLEDGAGSQIRDLKELVQLLELGLITREEYEKAKENLLNFK
jgi:hypothetical protein